MSGFYSIDQEDVVEAIEFFGLEKSARQQNYERLALANQFPSVAINPWGTVLNIVLDQNHTQVEVVLPDHTQMVAVSCGMMSNTTFMARVGVSFDGAAQLFSNLTPGVVYNGGSKIINQGDSLEWYYTGNKRALSISSISLSAFTIGVSINCHIEV